LTHKSTQTDRCSPILNEEEINEIERRSDLNLIEYFAAELRKVESSVSPCKVFNDGIRRKLVKSGALVQRRDRWALSSECRRIMRIR